METNEFSNNALDNLFSVRSRPGMLSQPFRLGANSDQGNGVATTDLPPQAQLTSWLAVRNGTAPTLLVNSNFPVSVSHQLTVSPSI